MEKEKIRGREDRLGGARMLEKEELMEGMWVWNDTKSMYQRVKRVPFQDGSYCWVDSQNNLIENDALYRFII